MEKVGGGDVWGGGGGGDCEGFEDEDAARAAAVASLLARSFRPNYLISLRASYSSASLSSSSSFNLCLVSRAVSSTLFKIVCTLYSRLASASPILARSFSSIALTSSWSALAWRLYVWPSRPPGRQRSLLVGIFPSVLLGENPPTFRSAFADDSREMPTFVLPRFPSRAWPQGTQAPLPGCSWPGEETHPCRSP